MYSDLNVSKLVLYRSMESQPQEEAKSFMYSDLKLSKLAIYRNMGWLSPRRRQRSSC